MTTDVYTGDLVERLIKTCEDVSGKNVPRSGDQWVDLCETKQILADKMADEVRDYGTMSGNTEWLWKLANRLQEKL